MIVAKVDSGGYGFISVMDPHPDDTYLDGPGTWVLFIYQSVSNYNKYYMSDLSGYGKFDLVKYSKEEKEIEEGKEDIDGLNDVVTKNNESLSGEIQNSEEQT